MGIRSSRSEVEASSTAIVPSWLSNQRRRRAGASTASHSSILPKPARSKTRASWPITITAACHTPAGSRRIAYMKAPRSTSLVEASGCRLEFIDRCDGSSTRSNVSPDDRSSVV